MHIDRALQHDRAWHTQGDQFGPGERAAWLAPEHIKEALLGRRQLRGRNLIVGKLRPFITWLSHRRTCA
jgi:hypothetical protein